MPRTAVRVFQSPNAVGEQVSERLLPRIEQSLASGNRFLLGCPTGRTPRPIYAAMARRLAEKPQNLRHLILVMMDEYLTGGAAGEFAYAAAHQPWSCHHFARVEIAGRLNASLLTEQMVGEDSIWFPDPRDPAAYDKKISDAGGVDFFVLASGASDGHVAFNPPGSPRESRTRIIELSDPTRRDNLQTFPSFGTLEAVPTHGISVGIDTIAGARESVMVVWGAGKRETLSRMRAAERYDPSWPATVIHECAVREILSDADAARPLDAD